MIEIKGNFLDIYWKYDAVCCTTNTSLNKYNELIMGAGIAKIFKDKWTFLPELWGKRILKAKRKNQLFIIPTIKYEGYLHLVAFPTKIDWRKNSSLELIESSAKQLEYLADSIGWEEILLPKPGCSNGGLKWEDVKPVISFLDDRFYLLSKNE